MVYMAFDLPLLYIRYEFAWLGTPEIQNFGFFMEKTDSGDYPAPGEAAAAQAVADKAVAAFKANIREAYFAVQVVGVRATAYTMQADGVHVSEKGVTPFSGANVWQGVGTVALPPENSTVLSLYVRDPGAFQGAHPGRIRGRVYLPTPHAGLLTNAGGLDPTAATDQLSDWQGWYDDITGVISLAGGDFHIVPVVRSLGGKSGPSAEDAAPVTWFRMGHVIDTQRRRRNKLPESYADHHIT